jgi:hypothetical protein
MHVSTPDGDTLLTYPRSKAPSLRWLTLLALPLLVCGCDDRGIRQRAEQIKELSDKEDHAYSDQALAQIKRRYWTLYDHAWFGKLPNGAIVRLASPHVTAAPLPSRAFYSGWHLQLTVTSQEWSTDPSAPHRAPFETVYAITRHSATNWDIRVTDGYITAPLHREDAPRLANLLPNSPVP